jgi:Kef-type K+ transport system membrane component KefB
MQSLILFQLAAVLLICRGLYLVLSRLRQPPVVCQMLAGVLIGPSLLGLWPAWSHLVFPSGSAGLVAVLSQLGLVLFMFCAGTELELGLLLRRARSTASISIASIAIPLCAGVLIAGRLVHDSVLFPQNVNPAIEIAFLGVAFAITAFPVMARIITESGLARTTVGTTALAAGSFTDAVAWCLLAILLAALSGSPRGAAITLGAAVLLVGLTLLARLPVPARLLSRSLNEWVNTPWQTPLVLVLLLLTAWASDVAGLHPAFGAFMVGLAMPRTGLIQAVRARIEPVAVNLLLPLYFVSTGLNTSIGLLAVPGLLLVGLLLLTAAVLSKGVSCWLVARLTGHSSREALAIGALMNARGLVELVVLGIALQHHIITPALFSIMVVIAILTTMMAGPVIHLVLPRPAGPEAAAVSEDEAAGVAIPGRS